LDPHHFVIFGSGPLLAHNIRTDIGDLDIVARQSAWERARGLGEKAVGPLNGAAMVRFWGGLIEVSQGWTSPEWNANDLIESADSFGGLRFARLEHVLSYKKSLRRAKDVADIVAIERHLAGKATTSKSVVA
jgi:hypothetical protein